VKAAIPKFHLPAHQERCHTLYSLNLRRGAGRLDGEVIERDWAKLGGAANSTKEMSAGSRRDTLDDLCSDMNFTKLKLMGKTHMYVRLIIAELQFALGRRLAVKLAAARSAYMQHSEAFTELSSSIDDALLSQWHKMVNDFGIDKTKPNPYVPCMKKCKYLGTHCVSCNDY